MTRHLLSLVLGIACAAAAACSSSDDDGYDGPGKNVVGEWLADGEHEVTIGEQMGSVGGSHLFRVYAQGDQLYIEDGACAFPALGEGNDRVSLMESDSCVRNDIIGEALTYMVDDGAATVAPGDHFTLEIRGRVRALGGSDEGTFSIVYVGERVAGGGGDGDGEGGGDDQDSEDGSGW
ncbi:MAG TPA: hypothetical protein VFU21_15430 [Kofleriaceae bacterium]|nr:hypothetical protein [Kofleriaceae bacterium]